MSDPVMIVLLVVAAVVFSLAIWIGRGVSVRKTKGSLSIEVKEKREDQQPKDQAIKVAEELHLTDVTAGDIAGEIVEGRNGGTSEVNSIEVAKKSTIKKSKIGDIVGSKQMNSRARGKS